MDSNAILTKPGLRLKNMDVNLSLNVLSAIPILTILAFFTELNVMAYVLPS